MKTTWFRSVKHILLATALLLAPSACGTPEPNENEGSVTGVPESAVDPLDNSFPDSYPVDAETALRIAREGGLGTHEPLFQDLIPADLDGDGEYEAVWAISTASRETYYVDPWDGDLVASGPPTEGLEAFLDEALATDPSGEHLMGTTPDTYESFPWGWNLPFYGSMYVSCGYFCGKHTKPMQYSLDWNLNGNKDCGNPLAAPMSGWVMNVESNGGYGYQIILKGASAGSGKYYIWRGAHLQTTSTMKPGWWVWQGRQIGKIGTTGTSTGCHIHSEAWRGTTSGKSVSGETLPWNGWPSARDNVDGYDGSTGSSKCFASGNGGSSGDTCP